MVDLPTEHWEQREFVKWFRQNYQERIFAIPNGEHRSPSISLRLKCEGVSSGVPDLFIPAWSVWIEMKRQEGGSVSKSQKDWHDYLESIGHTVFICLGCEDAKKKLYKLKNIDNM